MEEKVAHPLGSEANLGDLFVLVTRTRPLEEHCGLLCRARLFLCLIVDKRIEVI